jgi:hypothetical protein
VLVVASQRVGANARRPMINAAKHSRNVATLKVRIASPLALLAMTRRH